MKTAIASLLLSIGYFCCFGQSKDLLNKNVIKNVVFVNVYKIDRTSKDCHDQKNPDLFTNGVINTCFRFKKTLSKESVRRLLEVLSNNRSFIRADSNCFTSDYGMIFLDNSKRMIGHITTSTSCNNLAINNNSLKAFTSKANAQVLRELSM